MMPAKFIARLQSEFGPVHQIGRLNYLSVGGIISPAMPSLMIDVESKVTRVNTINIGAVHSRAMRSAQ